MDKTFEGLPFQPADILLPRGCDFNRWSVVACDQYTSQPEYWHRVAEYVGRAPSALRLILPESCLEGPSVETDIMDINNTMSRYLREDRFDMVPDALIYVERTLQNGKVRRGLVGMVDLEQYDYESGSDTAIRATEGTVLARIPPRVAVRKNAPIELPHTMLLANDREDLLIGPLAGEKDRMELLYDFNLMEGGGHLAGWRLNAAQKARAAQALRTLGDPDAFYSQYGSDAGVPMVLAVGDGNHSLATAKECYERQKRLTPPEQWAGLPARYALAELVNLHDEAVEFTPIHRLVFGADPEELLDALCRYYPGARRDAGEGQGHTLTYLYEQKKGTVTVFHPRASLPVGTLQDFLDAYLRLHASARVDYIHGTDVAARLAAGHRATAFLLPVMDKEELFPTILREGALPRKTFSMGQAEDKRFYLEARKIR